MIRWVNDLLNNFINGWYIPDIGIIDILEIFIISFFVYRIVFWIKNTKAWMLLRGLIILFVFILVAAILQMHTILFLARASLNVLAIVAVVVFQPELRRVLEQIGERNILSSINPFESKQQHLRFSDNTVSAILEASQILSREQTGALIVVEQATKLSEYEETGIRMDCLITKQILLNIFENKTPLHDGAIIVRGDRITSATCYLPLTDSLHISKDLGTRHRAAIGLSEVSDAMVIVISEESGQISVAQGGRLERYLSPERLRERLVNIQMKPQEGKKLAFWKKWRKRA